MIIKTNKPVSVSLASHLRQAVPGVDFVDFPDVVLTGVDGEQAGVGVVELNKDTVQRYTFILIPD